MRRTAAVAACPVRAETASAATITINASRLKPFQQKGQRRTMRVPCRHHGFAQKQHVPLRGISGDLAPATLRG
ncbi:hypothetical protein [uncultured Xanthomonas sp.]|uniref:hypothetical protein n=1 Tax=uncultured Xanthomonas sp. TaxID=152831 RepID=UPI0025F437D9|nr:hypothetical protein [uncultured Xanthomonas sp.]